MADVSWLQGRQAWVLASGLDMTSGLCAGLLDGGARVAFAADDPQTLAAAPAAVDRRTADFSSQAAAYAAVAALAEASGARLRWSSSPCARGAPSPADRDDRGRVCARRPATAC